MYYTFLGGCNCWLQSPFSFCPFLAPNFNYFVRVDKIPAPANKVS
nr:MAG TPA: hypothetical protein [Caudoviricetes sp.]